MGAGQILPGMCLLLGVWAAFFLSASAGLGGSLILVPVLSLALGSKVGVSVAALLLAGNNLVKLWAYRQALPLRASALVIACTLVGAWLGARLLVTAPEALVDVAVVVSMAVALLTEHRQARAARVSLVPTLAFAAGATSGFSGTSGPLKGVAVRSLGLDRMQTIGAAALVSAGADLTKVWVYASSGLLDASQLHVGAAAVPLMIAATYGGRHFAGVIGERGFARLFWLVMCGYAMRLVMLRVGSPA